MVDLRGRLVERAPTPKDADKLRAGCQGFALAKSTDESIITERPNVKVDLPPPIEAPHKAPESLHGRIFAPMVTVDPGEPTQLSSGYGAPMAALPPESGDVAVVDAEAERRLSRSVLALSGARDAGARDCLLPRAAAYSRGSLYVACAGTNTLVELDARSVDPSRTETRRWAVSAGPTGVAIDAAHDRAIVWSQFDREVAIVPIARSEGESSTVTAPVRVAVSRREGGMTSEVALGRKLFHTSGDKQISGDGRACASCHPDGREDALTWSTPDGPRQTPMLAGRIEETAPYGWLGGRDTLEEHVAQTFQRLEGTGLPDPQRDALLAFVRSLSPPKLRPAQASRAKLAERGHEIFLSAETGCATCHIPDRDFTDAHAHDIERAKDNSVAQRTKFDTPSLLFIGGTAPYFHDGRFATLDDLLASSDHAMGETLHLSRADRDALVAYLEQL
jgi:mono/diheme cytochrome c family protein